MTPIRTVARALARALDWTWVRLWRRPFFKRLFYQALGVALLPFRGTQLLNCGFEDGRSGEIPLPSAAEGDRLGCHLYHRVARSGNLSDADVIEFGCGRGGGARYLTPLLRPRSYMATDPSIVFILASRLRRNPPRLRFAVSSADRLAKPSASFDIAIAIEAIHPLPDKRRFLREAARLLRPGGRLLVADFFYARETSPNALSRFLSEIAASEFAILAQENWTTEALAAIDADSPRRLALIGRLPSLLRRPALAFACTTESHLYRQLRSGLASYQHFVLERAVAAA